MTVPSNTAARRGVKHRLAELVNAVVNDHTGDGGHYSRQVSKPELLATLVDLADDGVLSVNGSYEVVARCPTTLGRDLLDGWLCIQRRVETPALTWLWQCRERLAGFRDGVAELASRDEWCVAAKTAATFGHTHL